MKHVVRNESLEDILKSTTKVNTGSISDDAFKSAKEIYEKLIDDVFSFLKIKDSTSSLKLFKTIALRDRVEKLFDLEWNRQLAYMRGFEQSVKGLEKYFPITSEANQSDYDASKAIFMSIINEADQKMAEIAKAESVTVDCLYAKITQEAVKSEEYVQLQQVERKHRNSVSNLSNKNSSQPTNSFVSNLSNKATSKASNHWQCRNQFKRNEYSM